MKNIKAIVGILSLVLLYSFANAQGNCPGNKIKVYKGASGCGCHCMKECVTPAELPIYLENGWNTIGCWNCCFGRNWVEATKPKTSLEAVNANPEEGSLTISFSLATAGDVKLQIKNMSGRHIATVADEYREDLHNELIWDDGELSAGMYMLTLEAEDHQETKNFILR